MKKIILYMLTVSCFMAGCDSDKAKAEYKAKQLAHLTCDSSRKGRTQEELQAIGDACFRKGSFKKSTPQSW